MISNREYVFYIAVILAVLINEIAIESGLAICISLPLVLSVVAIGFWAFPNESSPVNKNIK